MYKFVSLNNRLCVGGVFGVIFFSGTIYAQHHAEATTASHHMHSDQMHAMHEMDSAEGMPETSATVTSTLKSDSPLSIGKETTILLSLKDAVGDPVTPDDLVEKHTEKLHLFVIDPGLTDYHHIHPEPAAPGDYTFTFTPLNQGKYLFYADIVPAKTNTQEYSISAMGVPGAPSPVEKLTTNPAVIDGYKFELSIDKPEIVQGEPIQATLQVLGPDKQPFSKLEPLMGAFAHMAAFSENREHLAHIHPQGPEPTSPEQRGGPALKFHMSFAHPGYYALFSQVQINGKDVFAPFGIEVKPKKISAMPPGEHSTTTQTAQSGETVKPLNNKLCPVSKEPVGSMEPGASVVYNNIRVGLCCSGCTAKFNSNPEAYLEIAKELAQ